MTSGTRANAAHQSPAIVLYFPPELLYEHELVDPAVCEHLQQCLLGARPVAAAGEE